MVATLLTLISVGLPFTVQANDVFRCGRIIILGNDQTPDGVIRALLPVKLTPGAWICSRDLRIAEQNLRASRFFNVNPWQGDGPMVQIVANEFDSEFTDIRILIREKPFNWLRFGLSDVVVATTFGDRNETYRACEWFYGRFCEHLRK